MSNELNAIEDLTRFHNPNAGTSFKGKDKYGQTFCLVVREGATAEMVKETMAHYFHAVSFIRDPESQANLESLAAIPDRTKYDTHHHSYTRVCIWGDVMALFKGKEKTVSINTCNEYTTALDLIHSVETMFDGMLAYAIAFPAPVTPENSPSQNGQSQAQETTSPQINTASQSQLPQNAPMPPTVPNNGTSELYGYQFMGSWDSKQQDTYRAYDKEVILFEVAKIAVAYEKNTGAKMFEPYGFFRGKASQYPAYGLKIYGDNENTPPPVSAFLNTIQKEADGHWLYAVRVAVKGEKVYLNIAGIAPKQDDNAVRLMLNAIPKN